MTAVAKVLRDVPFSISDNKNRLLYSSPGECLEQEFRNHGRRAIEICDGLSSKIEREKFLRMANNAQSCAVPGCGYEANDVFSSEMDYAGPPRPKLSGKDAY